MEDRFHLDDFKFYAHLNRFMEYNRIDIVELAEDHALLVHEPNENSLNINGSVHGGLLMTMMDIGSTTIIRKNGYNCATNEFNVNYLRPAHGKVFCKTELLKMGKRISVVHAWCYGEDGTVFCDGVANLCVID